MYKLDIYFFPSQSIHRTKKECHVIFVVVVCTFDKMHRRHTFIQSFKSYMSISILLQRIEKIARVSSHTDNVCDRSIGQDKKANPKVYLNCSITHHLTIPSSYNLLFLLPPPLCSNRTAKLCDVCVCFLSTNLFLCV